MIQTEIRPIFQLYLVRPGIPDCHNTTREDKLKSLLFIPF